MDQLQKNYMYLLKNRFMGKKKLMSKALGISPTYVAMLVEGERQGAIDTISNFENRLGLEPDSLHNADLERIDNQERIEMGYTEEQYKKYKGLRLIDAAVQEEDEGMLREALKRMLAKMEEPVNFQPMGETNGEGPAQK